ncbi:MAG: serine O-acetyltransferase EpsC [Chloroflexota bacterium]
MAGNRPERIDAAADECQIDLAHLSGHRRKLPDITKQIAASCHEGGNFDHVGAEMIPSWTAVIELVDLLRDILFPGYFGDQLIDESDLEYHLGAEVSTAFDNLAGQIARSIRHDCMRYRQVCSQCIERGQEEAITFLSKLPALRATLATDVRAAYAGDPAAKTYDEIVFAYPGLFAIMVYRVSHELWVQGIPLLPRMMTEYAHSKTGIDIHPGATIGESFFIDHGTGVVIGETAEVGKRVRVYQGVTIGARSVPRTATGDLVRDTKRHPTIEDDVTIYANATLLGGDTVIGARSIIGGSVWLTESVPADTVVVLDPPPLIFRSVARPLRDLA